MTPPQRGKPYLQVRLDDEVMNRLRAAAPEPERGKRGGVSTYVRRLLYWDLGLPIDEDLWDRDNILLESARIALAQVAEWKREGLPPPHRVQTTMESLAAQIHATDPDSREGARESLRFLRDALARLHVLEFERQLQEDNRY